MFVCRELVCVCEVAVSSVCACALPHEDMLKSGRSVDFTVSFVSGFKCDVSRPSGFRECV